MTMKAVLAIIAGITAVSAAVAQPTPSFEGKTLTALISSPPGGGTDMSGRLIASYLADRLQGKPKVVVKNMPGAQGVTAMNFFVTQVSPDGLTFAMASTSQADPLNFRRSTSAYDPTKFEIVGGVGRGGMVLIIRKDAEARLHDRTQPPAVMGSLGGIPRTGMQTTAWGVEFLGWNARWVVGYPGTNELFVALERGEIDMTATANLFQVRKMLETGKYKILAQTGMLREGKILRRAEFSEIPTVSDLITSKIRTPMEQLAYEYWLALTALDKWMALPPNTPAAYVQAYRAAFDKAFTDPDFADLGKSVSEDFEPMYAADIVQMINALSSATPEATQFIKRMLERQGLKGE